MPCTSGKRSAAHAARPRTYAARAAEERSGSTEAGVMAMGRRVRLMLECSRTLMDTATVPGLSTAPATGNIVDVVLARSRECPSRTALIVPTAWTDRGITADERMTFGQLGARIASYAAGA